MTNLIMEKARTQTKWSRIPDVYNPKPQKDNHLLSEHETRDACKKLPRPQQ